MNRNWFKKIFKFNQYERDIWVMKQINEIPPNSKVLDVGAGHCPYRDLFSKHEYMTQDFAQLNPNQLLGAKGYGKINYVSDILSIPVPDHSYDVILCTEVLEHVPEPIRALNEFARILKSGGKLILTAPLGSGLHQNPYHFYGGFTPFWFNKFLSEAGFKNITIEPNGGFFKYYGQESLRFEKMFWPSKFKSLGILRWALLPIWLISLPIFAIIIPILCYYIDKFDESKNFTVGYHVIAIRNNTNKI